MKNKTVSLIAGILLTMFIFSACGGNGAYTDETPTMETASQNSNYNYNFRSFELDIDTVEQRDAIEASFEEEKNGFEAEYKNKIADLNVKNGDAMEHLNTIFSSLNFDENTPDDEVIQKVSEAFGGVDFTEFELDVEFKDGIKKEYYSKK